MSPIWTSLRELSSHVIITSFSSPTSNNYKCFQGVIAIILLGESTHQVLVMEETHFVFYQFETIIVAVPTISVKLSRIWGTPVLRSIWPICYDSFLLTAEQHKVVATYYLIILDFSSQTFCELILGD